MARLEDEEEYSLAARLAACAEIVRLTCTHCGGTRDIERGCKLRWCPVCQRSLAAKRSAKYALAIGLMEWPLHVTLTVPHGDETYAARIRKLKKGFAKLRRKKVWTDRTTGGVVGFEIDSRNGSFHPHAHCVIDCRWLAHFTPPPQRGDSKSRIKAKCLAASQEFGLAWARCLGLATIETEWCGVCFKVRRVHKDGVEREILKYAVKGSDLIEHAEPIGPIIRALDGCRLVSSYGSCYGRRRATDGTEHHPRECKKCGHSEWMADWEERSIVRKSREARGIQ